MKGAKEPLGFDRGTELVPDFSRGTGIYPSILTSILKGEGEKKHFLLFNPTQATWSRCAALFLLPLMIKFHLNTGKQHQILHRVFQTPKCVKIYQVFC